MMKVTELDSVMKWSTIDNAGKKKREYMFNGVVNPPPSTERGKRRHAKRDEKHKQHAEEMWGNATRSANQSE